MISTKILIAMAFVMIGLAFSQTSDACLGVNVSGTPSKANCNAKEAAEGVDGWCCYTSVKTAADVQENACVWLTDAQQSSEVFFETWNAGWKALDAKSYNVECSDSFIRFSVLVIALFAFLF